MLTKELGERQEPQKPDSAFLGAGALFLGAQLAPVGGSRGFCSAGSAGFAANSLYELLRSQDWFAQLLCWSLRPREACVGETTLPGHQESRTEDVRSQGEPVGN